MAADLVEFEVEETVPEVEAMMGLIFDEDDKRRLVGQRRIHETRHRNSKPTKDSLMRFINFELRLLRLIHLRQKKLATITPQNKNRINMLEMYIKKRLNRLFLAGLRIFSYDPKIWISFLRFCKQCNMYSDGSRVLNQLLTEHGSEDHELYLLAADWETEFSRNLDRARTYLMMGIHEHRDNKDLLHAAFKLELNDTARRRKELADSNEPIDPTNPLLTTAKAEVIFDCSIKKLGDVELMNELLNLSAAYDFTENLYKKINDAIFEFRKDETMWHILAQRELNESSDEKISLKDQIKQCVALYDKAVKLLNTPKMWGYYLDALLDLNSKDITSLPNYKRKLLLGAFQRCANNKKLDEKYYLLWVGYLQGNEKHKKLVEMLNLAVSNVPQSVDLWMTLLRAHFNKNEDALANSVFDAAVKALGNKGLPLWDLIIEYEQLKRKNKVDRLFRRGIELVNCPDVSNPLMSQYLEWLVVSQGIVAARKAYDQHSRNKRNNLDMHLKMAYLERIQPTMNQKRIRICYGLAIMEFPDIVDVWVEFCKFELEYGSTDKLNELFVRASKGLDHNNFDRLRAEINVVQSTPTPARFLDQKMKNDLFMET